MRSLSRCPRPNILFALLASLSLTRPHTAESQAVTAHPTISGLSPTNPTAGQVVTISGSDLYFPHWEIKLIYQEWYSSFTRQVAVTGSSSSVTFAAPADVRPDSIVLQYTPLNSSANDHPIPVSERRIAVPPFSVRGKPDLSATTFPTVQGSLGGSFRTLSTNTLTLKGPFLLGAPSAQLTTSGGLNGGTPSVTTSFSLSTAPTVTFAGASVPVRSSTYVPNTRDEVVIQPPTSIPHGTAGFLTLATSLGRDSVPLTLLHPPSNAHVFESSSSNQVTNGQLVRGRQYRIRGTAINPNSRVTSTSFLTALPTISLGGIRLNDLGTVASPGAQDTLVSFSIPASSSIAGGVLSISHGGGTANLGSFTVIAQPAPLAITGAVITPNDIIGGNSATITLSFNPTPTNFSTAGEVSVGIPASLATAISPLSPVLITSNPMTITVPTKIVQTSTSGTIALSHNTPGGGTASVPVTVRPPRPTAVATASDTIVGGASATGSVSFDLPGQATVLLASSNPSVATVPASVVRTGSNAATFAITTTTVTIPTSLSISASLNGTSVSRTIVVRPGRMASLTSPVSLVVGGEPVPLTVTFDAPVTNAPVTFTSSDTALVVFNTSVTGTSKPHGASTTKGLAKPLSATLTAVSGSASRSVVVQVIPNQLADFTVSPASGSGGVTLAATARLTRTALQSQALLLVSSDTSVATVASPLVFFTIGEEVKVISILLKPQSTKKSATITATMQANSSAGAANTINTRTITVTAIP